MPAGARRQERGDRDANRRPRRCRRRGDALGVQPPEPEVQRHSRGVRAPRGRCPVRRARCSSARARCAIGDPSERDVFFGPVINERSVERYERAVAQARGEGTCSSAARGSPAACSTGDTSSRRPIARLPLGQLLFREELFVPFLAVGEVKPGRGARRGQPGGLRTHRRDLLARRARSSRASSTRSRPACATPTSARAPRPARGRARRRSAVGKDRDRPARAVRAVSMSPSSCESRAGR